MSWFVCEKCKRDESEIGRPDCYYSPLDLVQLKLCIECRDILHDRLCVIVQGEIDKFMLKEIRLKMIDILRGDD
jgi:hypothetical protein